MRCWSTHGMILLTRAPSNASVISGCGRPSRSPFSVQTTQFKNNWKKATTRCLVKGRQVSCRLSRIRLVCRSNGVNSGPALLLKYSGPPTFTVLARQPKGFLVSDIFFSHHKHKSLRTGSKLRVTSCGLP